MSELPRPTHLTPSPRHARLFDLCRQTQVQSALAGEFQEVRVLSPQTARTLLQAAERSFDRPQPVTKPFASRLRRG